MKKFLTISYHFGLMLIILMSLTVPSMEQYDGETGNENASESMTTGAGVESEGEAISDIPSGQREDDGQAAQNTSTSTTTTITATTVKNGGNAVRIQNAMSIATGSLSLLITYFVGYAN